MRTKSFCGLAALLFLCAGMLAQVQAVAAEDALDTIRERGVVRVAVSHSPPNTVKDIVTGEWSGLYPDIYEAIFSTIGVDVEYVETDWGSMIPGLQTGIVDMTVMGMTAPRALVFEYAEPLLAVQLSILLLEEVPAEITWEELDRPGFRVGTQGPILIDFAERVLPNSELVISETQDETFVNLQTGRVDAAISYYLPLVRFSEARDIGFVRIPEPVVGTANTIMFRTGNPDLKRFIDTAIVTMRLNGSLRAIFRKHGFEDFMYE